MLARDSAGGSLDDGGVARLSGTLGASTIGGERMRTKKFVSRWATRVAGTFALVCVPTIALAGWTGWVSEENGEATCGGGEAAYGFACSGDYCDNVALNCKTGGTGIGFWEHTWTTYFSEEPGSGPLGPLANMRVCTTSAGLGVVTGIQCRGDYCDEIRLRCSTPMMIQPQGITNLTMGSCYWTGWVSEENSPASFNGFITAIQCNGDYCDNKRFYMCAAMNAP